MASIRPGRRAAETSGNAYVQCHLLQLALSLLRSRHIIALRTEPHCTPTAAVDDAAMPTLHFEANSHRQGFPCFQVSNVHLLAINVEHNSCKAKAR
jgi:hypothetical protein